ncbi:hypothetical protein Dda_2093 [Drechslerella dactyloides]|uniref:DOC domain-containing protein n=1 Tax=Drechslerella dactyloides TaxID=74499 RepID=A0AAD6NM12_DREDA|nr:hypothetical protein Dda_2093 [Drechslerella dactyloides]
MPNGRRGITTRGAPPPPQIGRNRVAADFREILARQGPGGFRAIGGLDITDDDDDDEEDDDSEELQSIDGEEEVESGEEDVLDDDDGEEEEDSDDGLVPIDNDETDEEEQSEGDEDGEEGDEEGEEEDEDVEGEEMDDAHATGSHQVVCIPPFFSPFHLHHPPSPLPFCFSPSSVSILRLHHTFSSYTYKKLTVVPATMAEASTPPASQYSLQPPLERALTTNFKAMTPEQIASLHGLKEIGHLASWTVSTSKPGCGVAELRSDDTNLFWQSDGSQPHLINIHFAKRVFVKRIRIFLDYSQDESYTPTKIAIYAGTGYHDLQEVYILEFNQPIGWQEVPLDGVHSDGILRTFLIQVCVLSNHQSGKDTHVRGLQIYSPLEYFETPPPYQLPIGDPECGDKAATLKQMRRQVKERYSEEDQESVWNRIETARINAERRLNGLRPIGEDAEKDKEERILQGIDLDLEAPRPRPRKRPRSSGWIDAAEFDPAMAELR